MVAYEAFVAPWKFRLLRAEWQAGGEVVEDTDEAGHRRITTTINGQRWAAIEVNDVEGRQIRDAARPSAAREVT